MTEKTEKRILHNEAFIDGQNLYMNTKANAWKVDPARYRGYLDAEDIKKKIAYRGYFLKRLW